MPALPKPSSVCVTGAGGYIGGWIVKVLLDKGYTVHACVRDAASERNDFLRRMLEHSGGRLSLFSCDLSKAGALDEALAGCHGLVHTAADPDIPLEKRPEEYTRGCQHIVDSVNRTPSVLRVIYTSSAAAIVGDTDIRELQLRPVIDERRYPNLNNKEGINGYVRGKLQCEQLFTEAARSSEGRWDAIITNPGDNIGPILSETHAVVRKAYTPWHCTIAQIITKGTFAQSYSYRPWWTVDVRDTAEAHARLLEIDATADSTAPHSKRFLLCSTESIKVEEIGDKIAGLLPQTGLDYCHVRAQNESDTEAPDSDFLKSLNITEAAARKIWEECQMCNAKACDNLGITFRPLATSLRDCVESLISVAGVTPRQKNGMKRKHAAANASENIDSSRRAKLDCPAMRDATAEEIPVIDVGELLSGRSGSAVAVAAEIRQACVGTGFFYVSQHGLDEKLCSLLDAMKRYFQTPEKDKMTASIDQYQRGFRGQGHDQEPGRPPDCKESFDTGVDLPMDHPAVIAGVPMHGPNRWPLHFPALRPAAETYFEACEKLGRRLLAAVACSLDEEEHFFEQGCSEAMVQMRMFHYPPPPQEQLGIYGSSPHTDYGMITLLAQDPVGGLEVQMPNGEWVRAPYIEGTLVINIGDMLARLTNDVYHSTLHRVINRARVDRYSVATFYHLNAESLVTTLGSCSADGTLSKYKPIKYLSHIVSRFEEVLKARF